MIAAPDGKSQAMQHEHGTVDIIVDVVRLFDLIRRVFFHIADAADGSFEHVVNGCYCFLGVHYFSASNSVSPCWQ